MKKIAKLISIIVLTSMFGANVQAEGLIDYLSVEGIEVTEEDFYAYPYMDDLNIRLGPSTSYPVIGKVSLYEEIHVIGQSVDTGWYQVEKREQQGFVCNTLMMQTADDAVEYSINTNHTDLIKPIGNVPQERLDAFNDRLSLAPQWLLDAFVNSGWQIYLSEYDVGSTYGPEYETKLQGITFYDDRIIYLDNRDKVIDAVLHEFGHFVDWYFGWPSSSAGFAPLCADSGTFNSYFNFSNGVYYDKKELFAESFNIYLTRGNELAAVCPGLYQFMADRY